MAALIVYTAAVPIHPDMKRVDVCSADRDLDATACSSPALARRVALRARRGAANGARGRQRARRDQGSEVPLEEYVEATILSEFAPADGDPATVERMLEVQAVIGRTYAVGASRPARARRV